MTRLAANLPDALVGQPPAVDHGAGNTPEELPEDVVDLTAVLPVDPDRVEQLAEDVELELRVGAVADAYRPRAPVALEPVELDLGKQPFPADPVHDLQLARAAGSRPLQPVDVRLRLLSVAEREEGIQRQRRVAQPAEAVVPVALAADLLRQRRRRRRDDRARRPVRQPFEDERAADDLLAVRALVGAAVGPRRPRRARGLELRVHLVARQPSWRELVRKLVREDDERLLAGAQRPVALRRRELGVAERELALEHERVRAAVGDDEVVRERLEPRSRQPVVEARDELHLHRDLALGAADGPDQLVVRMRLADARLAEREEVDQHQRSGRRPERRLQHVRPRQVAPGRLVVVVERRDPEEAGLRPIEDPPEDRPRLEAMEGAPVDRAVLRDERTRVAVGDQAVIGDRKVAHVTPPVAA